MGMVFFATLASMMPLPRKGCATFGFVFLRVEVQVMLRHGVNQDFLTGANVFNRLLWISCSCQYAHDHTPKSGHPSQQRTPHHQVCQRHLVPPVDCPQEQGGLHHEISVSQAFPNITDEECHGVANKKRERVIRARAGCQTQNVTRS